eukprot:TRINITY_DN2101_c0_g1_i3.p2 TRINITY_DN2101_c0_g1~~TRINITY_DN2101_c0_g1_i3.p2  ORF type:complete len:123 (-),score=0.13 TRINITY_DN2101_c0_g1_i3:639-1007(-)
MRLGGFALHSAIDLISANSIDGLNQLVLTRRQRFGSNKHTNPKRPLYRQSVKREPVHHLSVDWIAYLIDISRYVFGALGTCKEKDMSHFTENTLDQYCPVDLEALLRIQRLILWRSFSQRQV